MIAGRLNDIFPEGVSHRNYCVRDVSARTVWVMFYAGAIEGLGRWVRPSMVTDMTDRQALLLDHVERTRWHKLASSSAKKRPARAWFAPNSREQIRDETIRMGLIPNGAVVQKKGVPTTSPAPKYALAASFADLFDATLSGHGLHDAIEKWQTANLSKSALARVTLLRRGATTASGHVLVNYPNGDTRRLSPGPSAVLSKARSRYGRTGKRASQARTSSSRYERWFRSQGRVFSYRISGQKLCCFQEDRSRPGAGQLHLVHGRARFTDGVARRTSGPAFKPAVVAHDHRRAQPTMPGACASLSAPTTRPTGARW